MPKTLHDQGSATLRCSVSAGRADFGPEALSPRVAEQASRLSPEDHRSSFSGAEGWGDRGGGIAVAPCTFEVGTPRNTTDHESQFLNTGESELSLSPERPSDHAAFAFAATFAPTQLNLFEGHE